MSELLPCPFCGGEAEIGYPLRYRNDIFTNQACCSKCGAAIYGEGIAANGATTNTKKKWNTRAERTITPVLDDHDWPVWRCPDCGQPINRADRYCSSCGAKIKVVE